MIVCCYNSSARLPETLLHLANQKVKKEIEWEIIIVDNNSSDDTAIISKKIWSSFNSKIPFKVVSEPKPGLNNARIKGFTTANFETLILCDDDNWLEENYVETSFEILENHPEVAIAGGRSTAVFESEKPSWFDDVEYAYVVGDPLPHTGVLTERNYLTGAGMVVRKELYNKLDVCKYQQSLNDRKGNSLSSGGDSELCLLAGFLNYKLYYDRRLMFRHFITDNRLRWKYCVELISKGFALSQPYFFMYSYCYKKISIGETPNFEYTWKRNIRKPLKELLAELTSLKTMFQTIKNLIVSTPASQQELNAKARWNKLKYALFNKKDLRIGFKKIEVTIHNVIDYNKAYKEILKNNHAL